MVVIHAKWEKFNQIRIKLHAIYAQKVNIKMKKEKLHQEHKKATEKIKPVLVNLTSGGTGLGDSLVGGLNERT